MEDFASEANVPGLKVALSLPNPFDRVPPSTLRAAIHPLSRHGTTFAAPAPVRVLGARGYRVESRPQAWRFQVPHGAGLLVWSRREPCARGDPGPARGRALTQ